MLILTLEVEPVRTNNKSIFLLETDKDIYKLGDTVIITFRNISNQTKYWSGNWPVPWDIYTYPEEEFIFQTLGCFCIFQISAGETITYKWNQSDMFTISPVELGDYVIRDNQGWGLSAHFKMVDADIIVPDDYSTIQTAINAASDGDTIFVRKGTYQEGQLTIKKPLLLIGEDRNTTIIDGQASWVCIYVQSSHDVMISGFAIQNGFGIYSYDSENVTITGNMISNNEQGIILLGSTKNTISKNIVTLNRMHLSIFLSENSTENVICENIVTLNDGDAIWLDNSSRNTIYGNLVSKNGLNTTSGHHVYGIRLSYSNYNVIYHNNLIDNYEQASEWMSVSNIWDNGCEGNYWSDYYGVDSDGDGIGDTPYVIDGSNQDNCPLMNPFWNLADINHDLHVNMSDVVLAISSYDFTPSDPNWNCHCDISEPYGVIDIFDIVMICASYGEEYTP